MAPAAVPKDRALAARTVGTMSLLVVLYGSAFAIGAMMLITSPFWGAVVLAVLGWIVVQSLGARRALLRELHARQVSPAAEPELHGIVDRLCALTGRPKPPIWVAEIDVANALAVGDSLCVTRGLLRRLTPAELEAVLAHELAHLAHKDGMVLLYAAAPGLLAGKFVGLFMRRGGRPRVMLVWLMLTWVVFFHLVSRLSTLLVLLLSRARELSADRDGAALTGRPSDLAAALVKLSGENTRIPTADLRTIAPYNALLCIEVPDGERAGLSAHPPLRRRLDRLARMSNQMGKGA